MTSAPASGETTPARTGASAALAIPDAPDAPVWRPSAERIRRARLTAFRRDLEARWGVALPDYAALHRFSVEAPERFWRSLFEWLGLRAERDTPRVMAGGPDMAACRWFPDTRLSLAENVLGASDARPALVARGEDGSRRVWSRRELAAHTARLAAWLRAEGVAPGDRVVAVLANRPEAFAVALAANAVGAVFSIVSPDFGVEAVAERFAPLAPRVLFAQSAHRYRGRRHDHAADLPALAARLPGLARTVVLHDGDGPAPAPPGAVPYEACLGTGAVPPLAPLRLAFDHPGFVFFSSGTTGPPKCILHGQGGLLLQLWKEHVLHYDVHPGDRFFQYTSTGWNMWYWLVTALAAGATAVLWDGSPFHPGVGSLFEMAEEEGVTHFGTSPAYLDRLRKEGFRPREHVALPDLRAVLSTGSPLPPAAYDQVHHDVKRDVCLSSISGGTEVMACFATGDPTGPVHRGELQAPALGMRTEIFDDAGRPLARGAGELVCTRPFPSLPLGFWDDPDGRRYRAAYFERFPGVWHHGDWAERTAHGGFVIHGRSDATLKPGGVRIGTAELYRPANRLDEVLDSLAVAEAWGDDVRVVLFVKLRPGLRLGGDLEARIRAAIREAASPRHVPAVVAQVDDVPYTRTGKLAELAVRDLIHGRPVRNRAALRNPEALESFALWRERASAR